LNFNGHVHSLALVKSLEEPVLVCHCSAAHMQTGTVCCWGCARLFTLLVHGSQRSGTAEVGAEMLIWSSGSCSCGRRSAAGTGTNQAVRVCLLHLVYFTVSSALHHLTFMLGAKGVMVCQPVPLGNPKGMCRAHSSTFNIECRDAPVAAMHVLLWAALCCQHGHEPGGASASAAPHFLCCVCSLHHLQALLQAKGVMPCQWGVNTPKHASSALPPIQPLQLP